MVDLTDPDPRWQIYVTVHVARCRSYVAGLAISRTRVQLPAAVLPGSDPGRVVHTHASHTFQIIYPSLFFRLYLSSRTVSSSSRLV